MSSVGWEPLFADGEAGLQLLRGRDDEVGLEFLSAGGNIRLAEGGPYPAQPRRRSTVGQMSVGGQEAENCGVVVLKLHLEHVSAIEML